MKNETFLEIAKIIAKESTCVSKQVGALIVKDDRIVSTGYNGTPRYAAHCDQIGLQEGWLKYTDGERHFDRSQHTEFSEVNEIHAEQNAICYAARAGISTESATMYITISPCHHCAKLIVAAGITKIVVGSVYDKAKPSWSEWLASHGVTVEVLDND